MDRVNDLEYRQAKRDGAKLVKNSGRGMNKGDAETDSLLIDYKFTDSKSYSINIESFRKHYRDATSINKQPVIVAIFTSNNDKAVAIVDWQYLKQLEEIKQSYEGEYGPWN